MVKVLGMVSLATLLIAQTAYARGHRGCCCCNSAASAPAANAHDAAPPAPAAPTAPTAPAPQAKKPQATRSFSYEAAPASNNNYYYEPYPPGRIWGSYGVHPADWKIRGNY